MRIFLWRHRAWLHASAAFLTAAVLVSARPTHAQQPAAPAAPATPRAAAPIDLTGNWVSVVTEEWRWRMVTPPKGDFTSIPLSDAGRLAAGKWDPATDLTCQAFGAGGLMRMPTRLSISWQGDDVLKVDSDAGQQTRLLRFGPAPAQPGPRSLQGLSLAQWEPLGGTPARGPARIGGGAGGTLHATTTNLLEGWLRRNGVAYSDATSINEYWDRVAFPNGDVWLIVTQYVTDPKYLVAEYSTSMHFKREADGSKFKPTPCRQL